MSFAKIERVEQVSRLHGQGYDRASTMRGERWSIHTLITEKPYILTVLATLSI